MKVVFTKDPKAIIAGLTKGMRNKAMRISLNKAASPVKAAVISTAPARFGFLKKAQRIKVKHYQGGNIWVAVVGPTRSVSRKKGVRTRGPKKGEAIIHKPANYARLVEKGHGGPRPAPAKSFLRPALSTSKSTYFTTLEAALAEQVKKLLPQG